MRVGAGRIVLDFYNNTQVSLKRRQLKELCEDLRKKFNVSAMEIADFDDPERCVIGFSTIFPDDWNTRRSRGLMEKICKRIDETAFARVMVEDWDLLSYE
jgi:uncharacterized protein YlxP (DUF503 family)